MDVHALAIRHLIGPVWARWERSPYLRHYRLLRRTQYDAPEVIRKRQLQRLQAIIRHAYETVPFYRRAFQEVGFHPDDLRSFKDLRLLPVLTKRDLANHTEELISGRYDPALLYRKQTSGSTGVPLTVFVDQESLQWKRACTLRSDEWSGWRFGERVAMLWGNPPYLRKGWRGRLRNALLERACYLDTLKMDEATLAAFARALRRRQPGLIFGHAHSVYLFADYLRSTGQPGIRPHGIITSAMVLHDWQRRVIEEVFRCPVTNRYGCEEVSLIACECEHHRGLHVNSDGVFVEVLRDGRPVGPGEPGSVVVTDLSNRGMPILRYQVGDVATLAAGRCPCGRGLPRLERLEGREADYVLTARGELISGISLTENFACELPGVAQLQIIQETVQHFRFRMVRGQGFGPDTLDRLGALVIRRFGADAEYECEYVDRIPQEPSGKYRFCISRVANPFTRPQEVLAS